MNRFKFDGIFILFRESAITNLSGLSTWRDTRLERAEPI